MALAEPADIDVKTDVLRERIVSIVSANMVFADVRCSIAVLLERLGNRDRLDSNIFALFRASKTNLCTRRYASPSIGSRNFIVQPIRWDEFSSARTAGTLRSSPS